jgi:hypothetical protein
VGITDERNDLAVDQQVQLDHLPSLDELKAPKVSF